MGHDDRNLDIRWKQRFHNLERAFLFLERATSKSSFNELEAAGLVQSFEFTFELGWKTLKDYLTEQAFIVQSPRETIKQAFQSNYLKDGHIWMEMLEQRNLLTHTYNEEQAKAATQLICHSYFPALRQLYLFLKGQL
ncbi:MAG: nucleotidyltransferase substrate binding protein [Candidatus Protochlamydia sp.]|nr:nucleotidyltransferase substrate binding protein [Candidatus Protochlamydia sp.]